MHSPRRWLGHGSICRVEGPDFRFTHSRRLARARWRSHLMDVAVWMGGWDSQWPAR
jgi:hypothetical protein